MTIHIDKLIEVLAQLCEDKNLKASGSESLKGGLVTGISAALGGLLLGPVGLAIGGAMGGIGSAIAVKNFKPVASIIREMSPIQKKKLADTFLRAFRDFGIEDILALSMMLTSSASFQKVVIKELTNFMHREMSMKIENA